MDKTFLKQLCEMCLLAMKLKAENTMLKEQIEFLKQQLNNIQNGTQEK